MNCLAFPLGHELEFKITFDIVQVTSLESERALAEGLLEIAPDVTRELEEYSRR